MVLLNFLIIGVVGFELFLMEKLVLMLSCSIDLVEVVYVGRWVCLIVWG